MADVTSAFNIPRTRDDVVVARPAWSRVGWGEVLAGAVAAISVQLLFTVLGIAIGITAADPDLADDVNASAEGVSMAAGAWWLISGTLSLLIGGMVLGRVSRYARGTELYLHGFTLWAVTAVFGFAVIWSGAGMASMAGMYGVALGSNISSADASRVANTGRNVLESAASGTLSNGTVGTNTANDATTPGTTPAATPGAATSGTTSETTPTRSAIASSPALEEAHDNARAASWWSVIALLVGIAAAIGGAHFTAGHRTYVANAPAL